MPKWLRSFVHYAFLAVGLTLLITVVLAAFRLPVGESFRLIGDGSFGSPFAISRTFLKATPLLCTALGMVVAWRAGMFNVGGEGQYVMGGVCAASVAPLAVQLPPWVGITVLTCTSVAGGALFALLPAALYIKRNVQVVISTILLNFVAFYLLEFVVNGPLQRAKRDIPQSERLPDSHMFGQPNPQLDYHAGMVLALLSAVALGWVLTKTVLGFRIRLIGENSRLAMISNVNPNRYRCLAMAISGGLCGLGAACQYIGVAGYIDKGFSQQWGFLGIPAALLGDLTATGATLASLFFGALFAGSENLARFTPGSATMIYVIQAAAVLGAAAYRKFQKGRIGVVES